MNEASDTLPTEAAQYALYITDESRAKAVGLRYDGSVEFRGVTPDEASRLFWDSMGREMIVRAAVLARAAVPAVQPKEQFVTLGGGYPGDHNGTKKWRVPGMVWMVACGTSREVRGMFDTPEQAHAFVASLEADAAPQAEARQEQPVVA